MLPTLFLSSLALVAQAPTPAPARPTGEEFLAQMKAKATDPATLDKQAKAAKGCQVDQDSAPSEQFITSGRSLSGAVSGSLKGQVVDSDIMNAEDKRPTFTEIGSRLDVSAFTVIDKNGNKLKVASLQGMPVLVVLFKPECKFTEEILTEVIRLQTISASKHFVVLPVSLSRQGWSGLTTWREKNRGAIPAEFNIFVPSTVSGEGASLFPNVKVMPTVFILDGRGGVAWRINGAPQGSIIDKLNHVATEVRVLGSAPVAAAAAKPAGSAQ